jgi:alanine racemase
MPKLSSPGNLKINLKHITSNYNLISKTVKKAKVACIVKADAYGLGVKRIASTLHASGCKHFFVANLKEGVALRKVITDQAVKVYVFSGSEPSQEKIFETFQLIPVINSLPQLERWYLAMDNNVQYPIALHIDTGMNRLGFSEDEFREAVKSFNLKKTNVDLLLSHLVASENSKLKKNLQQLDVFKKLAKLIPNAKRSIANSHGVALGKAFHLDLVRPGLSLYVAVSISKTVTTKNTISLLSPILQVRRLNKSAPVGYGATERAPKGAVLATIGCGYADGYLRCMSGVGSAWLGGLSINVVGRVSMDLTTFNISDLDASFQIEGQVIELFGDHQPISQLAASGGTIAYEIITNLGTRWKRVYI